MSIEYLFFNQLIFTFSIDKVTRSFFNIRLSWLYGVNKNKIFDYACSTENEFSMIKLTDEQIKEVAGLLDAGMRCYYNKKTGEIKHILNFESWIYADEELWEEDIKEIDENRENYIEFEPMSSRDSFRVMADFIDTLVDHILQAKLVKALNKRKPFQNFKWVIDNSGEYRQQWFDYKNSRYIEWVVEQLESGNRSSDFESSEL